MGKKLNCGVCHKVLKDNDMVFLDELNTVVHIGCYSSETNLPMKDIGSYRSIVEKYDFFHEFQKDN